MLLAQLSFETASVVEANGHRALVLKLLKHFNRFVNLQRIHVVVSLICEVLRHCQDLRHLRKTQIQLVHLFVPLLKPFQQVLNLELDLLLVRIVGSVLLHFLHLFDVFADSVR